MNLKMLPITFIMAKNLRELNKELEEENNRYSEEQMNEMYNYYKGKGY